LPTNEVESELFSDNDINTYLKKSFIHKNIKIPNDIIDILKITRFTNGDLFKLLENEKFLKNKSKEWFKKLYNYLGNKNFNLDELEKLSKLKIFLVSNGKFLNSKSLFFPLGFLKNRTVFGGFEMFEKSLNIIDQFFLYTNDILELTIVKFFENVGLKYSSPSIILTNFIVPLYKDFESVKLVDHFEHSLFIRENFNEFTNEEVKLVKSGFYILNNKKKYCKPHELYLSKSYLGENEPVLEDILVEGDYISNEYVEYTIKLKKEISKDYSKESEYWRILFNNLDLQNYPRFEISTCEIDKKESKSKFLGSFGAKISDIKLGKDLEKMLEANVLNTIIFIDYYWKYYCDGMNKKITIEDKFVQKELNSSVIHEDSTLLKKLKESIIKIQKDTFKISDLFYIEHTNKSELFFSDWPLFPKEIKNKDLRRKLGISEEFNLNDILKRLYQLKSNKYNLGNHEIYNQCFNILKYLKKFENKLDVDIETIADVMDNSKNEIIFKTKKIKKVNISEILKNESLIFINSKWFKITELFWEQNNEIFLNSLIPPIETLFNFTEKELYKIFLLNLGVNPQRPIKDIISVFEEYSEKSILENDIEYLTSIYLIFDEMLDQSKDLDFLKTTDKNVILTTLGLKSHGTKVYYNDDDEIFDLFKNKLPLFNVSKVHLPKLQNLIKFLKIESLKLNLKIEIEKGIKNIEENNEISIKIKKLFSYIERYIAHNDQYSYKLNEETFKKLNNFKVGIITNQIKFKYIVENKTADSFSNIKYDSNQNIMYIKKEEMQNNNIIILEIINIFKVLKIFEFKSFVYSIYNLNPDDYMKFNNINDLTKKLFNFEFKNEKKKFEIEIIKNSNNEDVLSDQFKEKGERPLSLVEKYQLDKERKMNEILEKERKLKEEKEKNEKLKKKNDFELLSDLFGFQFKIKDIEREEEYDKKNANEQFKKISNNEYQYQLNKEKSYNRGLDFKNESSTIFHSIPTQDSRIFKLDEENTIKVDQVSMQLSMHYELKRLRDEHSNMKIDILNYDTDVEQYSSFILDVSTPEKIDFSEKYSPSFQPILRELRKNSFHQESLGFDILTINPKTRKIDRAIELKSSKTIKSQLEISTLEWESAKSSYLKDKFYLYFIANCLSGIKK
jgi:hypothetical protein